MKISRKQYYSRISKLKMVGLLKVDGRSGIQPSILRSLIFKVITTLDTAMNVIMKLRTIDAMKLSGVQTKEEIDKLIDSMIEDVDIKSILKKHLNLRGQNNYEIVEVVKEFSFYLPKPFSP